MQKSYHLSNFISVLVLLAMVGGVAYYSYANRPCGHTVYYRIGTFNSQFGISQSDFLADAQQAASLWNDEAGHTLLAYSATGTMPLNLIYDNRQQQTNIGESISQQEDELGAEKSQVAVLQSQYDAAKQQYESDQAAGKDIPILNSEAASLNALATQIQSQVDALNAKIDAVNANANAFNSQAGTSFEEGEFVEAYGSSHIDLYEFKNNTQLIRLMAHEFGHSLGLDHNTDPNSIMYPENIATNLSLSTEDTAELQARCAVTLQNLNPFQNVSFSSL
jgi:predicted Zn-dependent protease